MEAPITFDELRKVAGMGDERVKKCVMLTGFESYSAPVLVVECRCSFLSGMVKEWLEMKGVKRKELPTEDERVAAQKAAAAAEKRRNRLKPKGDDPVAASEAKPKPARKPKKDGQIDKMLGLTSSGGKSTSGGRRVKARDNPEGDAFDALGGEGFGAGVMDEAAGFDEVQMLQPDGRPAASSAAAMLAAAAPPYHAGRTHASAAAAGDTNADADMVDLIDETYTAAAAPLGLAAFSYASASAAASSSAAAMPPPPPKPKPYNAGKPAKKATIGPLAPLPHEYYRRPNTEALELTPPE